ncbi:sugar ABC transporter permease [Vagococcus sp. PNs007]|uniref:Sugar ABC transporter permease n=1 Tax=Vagococcus proximus TaxID=2991417 RepID=A0ABT5X020_9ENTE|nr:sugar ABC transporter permease [Vagococcus proximus]MDF0479350.1 sugar ABC transporter permease [Vagococcus proximus]
MVVKSFKEKAKVLVMLVPTMLLYTLFLVIPIILAVYFSVHQWNGIPGSPLTYVGFKNFVDAFKDDLFRVSVVNLFKLVFFSVLFHTPIALILAVALQAKLKGSRFFKVIFFVPTIFPLTAIGLLWYFIFMPNGAINSILEMIGLGTLAQGWLINPSTAIPVIIFVNIWAGVGYYMIILLAGLKTIPEEIYDAAKIDGASEVKQFFNITVPMLKPIISMCVLLDIIGTIKSFDLVFVMTGGGPNDLTNLPTTLMYNQAFKYDNYGMGSALGIIILVMVLVLTILSDFIMNRKKKGAVD